MQGTQEEKEKDAAALTALAFAVAITAQGALVEPPQWAALRDGAPWWAHLTYQALHVSALHGALNGWALCCVVHRARRAVWRLWLSVAAAALLPHMDARPVYGLSVALMVFVGQCLPPPTLRTRPWAWAPLLPALALGYLFDGVAANAHLCGVLAGSLLEWARHTACAAMWWRWPR